MNKDRIVIKKYANRRLYDTSASRYVNLEDVAAMIREGADVQIVDAKTGEDLTRVTLTQIIVEDTKDQPAGLPLELLRQLIVASDQARQDFLMWYLKSAFDTYQKLQDAVQSQLSDVRAAATPFEAMFRYFTGFPAQQGAPPANTDVDELRRKVAELEAREKSRRPARKSPPRKKREKSPS